MAASGGSPRANDSASTRCDKPKPNEALPSISEEIQRQTEADQTDIKKQLKHANEQLALTNIYPGRTGDSRST